MDSVRVLKTMGVILPSGYAYRQLGIDSSAVTGGAGVEWTPTPDIFTYFRYGRGYESPSFNAGQVLANPAVGAEFLNSYEVGYKQSFGKQLMIDVAAYYYDYDGLQLPISVTNGGVTQSQFINSAQGRDRPVSSSKSYWSPVKDLLITASYSPTTPHRHSDGMQRDSGVQRRRVLRRTPTLSALSTLTTRTRSNRAPTPSRGKTRLARGRRA